ncbi:hypothetical protein [uncultured Microbacterium sp.]|uniref:Uncharacterized protein n=1 Tax=uncultured Microbacterium sp. TaxID=191216 RepID=A0A1Y5NVJ1_9MICO|nr:hypothetical protein [uncultured Microbacterium sp.]SBS70436.1 hypothetical protein MIPYR_10481 [uncultured Microbacterium sp.]
MQGLFLASTHRFVFDVTGPPGSGERVVATRYYLLSGDGRFHRGWGLPSVPGGDIAAFDFAAVETEDAYNTGTYTVEGERILFHPMTGDEEAGVFDGDRLHAEQLSFDWSTPGR